MPRVLVTTDGPKNSRQVLVDELVSPEHLNTHHSAEQLIERLAWGIEDAARAEAALKDALAPTDYRQVPVG